jgi:hypothetical protein
MTSALAWRFPRVTFPASDHRLERLGDLLPGPEETAGQGGVADAEGIGGLAVLEPGNIYSDERIAEVNRQRRNRFIDQTALQHLVRLWRGGVLEPVDLVRRRECRPAARAAMLADKGVAKDAEEVAEIVVVPEKPRLRQDLRIGVLD